MAARPIPFPGRPDQGAVREQESEMFLTVQMLMDRWHCSDESIYRIPAEALPFTRPLRGRQRLYKLEDVAAREDAMREGRTGT